jgi:hypothetical protein
MKYVQILVRKPVGEVHLGGQEKYGRRILRWMLGRMAVSMRGGWNWLRIVAGVGLSY